MKKCTLHLRHMICDCCVRIVRMDLEAMGVKIVKISLVHHTTFNAMVLNSDYLVGKFGKTYPYLSTQFKTVAGVSVSDFTPPPAKYCISIDKHGKDGIWQ